MDAKSLRKELSRLERASGSLEPPAKTRSSWQAGTDQTIAEFLDSLSSLRTFHGDQNSPNPKPDLSQDPVALLQNLREEISQSGILTAGPGHLGFIPGGGLYIGAIADHFAAATNTFSGDAFASPAAVRIHSEVIQWLMQVVGYDAHAWGDITSGGSQATLTAFHVARQAHGIKPKDYAKTIVYMHENTHHCSQKALFVLFGGDIVIRNVPLKNQIMDAKALATMIDKDRACGLKPWLIVASAGSTNLGKVDPLAEIASIASDNSLWFHVDAAYGGFFAITSQGQRILRAIAEADSIVLDPHKGLFLPYGIGALLVKDGQKLFQSCAGTGVYLQDRTTVGPDHRSPMDYSLELTRPFRSLRLWLALAVHGQKVFEDALTEKILLARYACLKLSEIPGIEIICPPELSVFAFRYRNGRDKAKDVCSSTQDLLRRINNHGEVFLTSTVVDDQYVIRVAVLSFRTHIKTIDQLIEIVKAEVET